MNYLEEMNLENKGAVKSVHALFMGIKSGCWKCKICEFHQSLVDQRSIFEHMKNDTCITYNCSWPMNYIEEINSENNGAVSSWPA
jgi:lipoprotein NlpI